MFSYGLQTGQPSARMVHAPLPTVEAHGRSRGHEASWPRTRPFLAQGRARRWVLALARRSELDIGLRRVFEGRQARPYYGPSMGVRIGPRLDSTRHADRPSLSRKVVRSAGSFRGRPAAREPFTRRYDHSAQRGEDSLSSRPSVHSTKHLPLREEGASLQGMLLGTIKARLRQPEARLNITIT